MSPAFWQSFEKRAGATSGLTGGEGFTGAGKGSLGTAEKDRFSGTLDSHDGTKTDKTLLDRERGPRTDDPFGTGPEFQDESNPHIRY